jgi:bifunctional N-acetylglucosamine-1-phosphate-uridyltransferase/glucosamine-1-phosphate-acetyltransferase GlmU-like protein
MKREDFYPLTYWRDVSELRCGARTLADHPRRKINHLWELIINLKDDLEEDLRVMGAGVKGEVHPSVVFYNQENILLEAGAEVEAGAVLDARSGPIYIGKGTIIRALTSLRGPLSIGPGCRIGGEVVASIIHGNSNKGHYGFLGHSYVGEWVNLGAGTTNSNLKNNYSSVKVKGIDTGQQFMGCLIGDFVKTGIGTLINTGTVIGFGANVMGGKVTPKNIPNFQWNENERYRLDDFFRTVELMMGRRGVKLTKEQIDLIKKIL